MRFNNDKEDVKAAFYTAFIYRRDGAGDNRIDQPGPDGLHNCQVDPGSGGIGASRSSLEDVVVQEVES